jgi:hypothetical protein
LSLCPARNNQDGKAQQRQSEFQESLCPARESRL